MAENAKAMKALKRLNCKKDSLFMRVQTLNDMIPSLDNEKRRDTFLVSARTINRSAFENLLDDIHDINMDLDSDYTPSYQAMNAFDDLHGNILSAVDKIHLLRSAESKQSTSISEQKYSDKPFKNNINLPPLEIKPFCGDVRDWPRYRDLFSSVIVHNPKLSDVERLHYLITTVSGTPSDIIKNYPLSGDNFKPAWTSLSDRYESDRILASHYFEHFTQPHNIPAKPSLESLQSFLSKITHNVTGLKNMRLDDLADFLLLNLSIRQLDPVTRKNFESKIDFKTIPSYDSLIDFVKSECRLLEITSTVSPFNTTTARKIEPNTRPQSTFPARKNVLTTQSCFHNKYKSLSSSTDSKTSAKPLYSCKKCGDNHHLYRCPQFLNQTVSDRQAFVKRNAVCINCLGNHTVSNCKSAINCLYCNCRHHRLLHFNKHQAAPSSSSVSEFSSPVPPPTQQPPLPTSTAPVSLATVENPPNLESQVILLGTATALIKNINGKFIRFRLLIDCASTASFISKALVDLLGLPITPTQECFSGLSDVPVASGSGTIECNFKPVASNHPQIRTRAFVVNSILNSVPRINLPESCKHLVQGLSLADPQFHLSSPVDMLLGCDILPKILVPGAIPPHSDQLGVLCTIFGHVIIGNISTAIVAAQSSLHTSLLTYPTTTEPGGELHKVVERFWESEHISSKLATNPADDYCEQHFAHTHVRDATGRYTIEMPFTKNPESIDFFQSKDIALQRFYSLEKRFSKNLHLKNDCIKFLKEYEALGHMVKADRPGKYFIPYFCVFNPNSPTTPTRVVFDGSAKKSHISLNDILHSGPKLQHEVPDVLLNFRLDPLVFCCDISKMYRQINVKDEQCSYQHIFFRDEPGKSLEEYELRTVTYGLSPSAFCSQRCLVELTRDLGHKYPLAVPVILENSVVDDFFAGAKCLDSLLEIKSQLCSLLSAGGFPLNKWLSNCPAFLDSLKNSDPSSSLVIRDVDDHSVKVLGVGWDPRHDVFFFSLDPPTIQEKYSKRQILSAVARIYDPLGFAAPVIFLFKCLLKNIWLSGVDWDSPISASLTAQWNQCLSELHLLREIKIPRCLFSVEPISCQLIGFSDGSLKGSAAVLYLRVQYTDQSINIFLLKSKTRVAPSKGYTVPRLELVGALLLTQLLKSIEPFLLKIPVPVTKYLCCDSTIVLSWIRKPPHTLKLFVSNRVSIILENSLGSDWYHVSTENNVSDCASRGLTPKTFYDYTAWLQGPNWAYDPPENWPLSSFEPLPADILPEVKPVLLTSPQDTPDSPPSWITNCSNLIKLKRISAYVLRFTYNIKNPLNRLCGILTVSDLRKGLSFCIRTDQAFYFKEEIQCLRHERPCSLKIQCLSPFIGSDGLIRVGGRLKNSSLPYDSKHQILLHKNSYLTYLIIVYFHESYLHAGVRTLQALLMSQFWILNSKQTIKRVVHKCIRCSRFRINSTANPPMGDLPAARVTPGRPFSNCAIDLAGPFVLKESLRRNSKTYKAYFSLFVCLAVKAVHVEILTSLSSDCFIAALTRFSCRRGLPAHIYCDQGTNFKGAARQLSEIVQFLRSEKTNEHIVSHLAAQGIEFHFNVPRAPFMSGLAESNVKNVKYHLTRAVGTQILTLEEFSTVTARVEAILNSRPLCSLSNSPDDFTMLTPGHFLLGSSLVSPPEFNLEHVPTNRLSRWQLVTHILQTIWRRWEAEYLYTLQAKQKWFSPFPNIEPGQLVWLHEDNCPPLTYPLGRIEQVHPGKDGIVRAVTVRTSTGTYRRPARKVAPLPIS